MGEGAAHLNSEAIELSNARASSCIAETIFRRWIALTLAGVVLCQVSIPAGIVWLAAHVGRAVFSIVSNP